MCTKSIRASRLRSLKRRQAELLQIKAKHQAHGEGYRKGYRCGHSEGVTEERDRWARIRLPSTFNGGLVQEVGDGLVQVALVSPVVMHSVEALANRASVVRIAKFARRECGWRDGETGIRVVWTTWVPRDGW